MHGPLRPLDEEGRRGVPAQRGRVDLGVLGVASQERGLELVLLGRGRAHRPAAGGAARPGGCRRRPPGARGRTGRDPAGAPGRRPATRSSGGRRRGGGPSPGTGRRRPAGRRAPGRRRRRRVELAPTGPPPPAGHPAGSARAPAPRRPGARAGGRAPGPGPAARPTRSAPSRWSRRRPGSASRTTTWCAGSDADHAGHAEAGRARPVRRPAGTARPPPPTARRSAYTLA